MRSPSDLTRIMTSTGLLPVSYFCSGRDKVCDHQGLLRRNFQIEDHKDGGNSVLCHHCIPTCVVWSAAGKNILDLPRGE